MVSTHPGERLDREALGVAIEVADEAIAGRRMPRARYAELIAQLYEALAGGWPVGGLVGYARATADELLREDGGKPAPPEFRQLRVV